MFTMKLRHIRTSVQNNLIFNTKRIKWKTSWLRSEFAAIVYSMVLSINRRSQRNLTGQVLRTPAMSQIANVAFYFIAQSFRGYAFKCCKER